MIPNIWGQGQIFAFSALDGNSPANDDFTGTLCGDKIGICFHTKVKRELCICGISSLNPEFRAVTGDVIKISTNRGDISIVYADTHIITGCSVPPAEAFVFVQGPCETEIIDGVTVHNTSDGEFTALLKTGRKFCFAFAHSQADAVKKVKQGIEYNTESIVKKRLSVYDSFALKEDKEYAMLYAKCISVMKTQLYSPEGNFKRIWSTPDRLPHKNLWLWDSVFHAIGHRNLNASLAEDLILALFDAQEPDGFIPHMAAVPGHSDITQPPVIAWGACLVYQKSGNKDFLKKVLDANGKFLLWCDKNRRQSDEKLYTWLTTDIETCRCDECGMDNSPRFDLKTKLLAIDFSCFMANETRYMKKIAEITGDIKAAEFYGRWYEDIKNAVNSLLWCEEDGFYYDYDLINKRLHRVQSVASFLPLFAGICDKRQAEKLVSYLIDPNAFYTSFPIPSISKKDSTYGNDMWRGAVWINYDYMIINGLRDYGFYGLADDITEKLFSAVDFWYRQKGCIFEFYDPENKAFPGSMNRKGRAFEPYDFDIRYQSIRDYGWSATLTFDLLHNKDGA